MTNKQFVVHERKFTLEMLQKLTPEQWHAQTLCEGWSVEYLAAHLVSRERNIIGGIGLVMPRFHKLHDKRIEKIVAKGHRYILEKLQNYPRYMPASVNTAEFWVHNEDFLRGELSMSRATPSKEENEILWASLKGLVKVRKSMVSDIGNVDLVNSESNEKLQIRFNKNSEKTIVTATAGELLLWFYGRRDVAKVNIESQ